MGSVFEPDIADRNRTAGGDSHSPVAPIADDPMEPIGETNRPITDVIAPASINDFHRLAPYLQLSG